MKNTVVRMINLLIVVLVLVIGLIVFGGKLGSTSESKSVSAATTDLCGGNVSISLPSTLSSVNSQTWTKEQMLAAQPYPLEIVDSPTNYSLQLNQPRGEPGYIEGSPPAADFQGRILQQNPQSASQATASGYSYPSPFVRFQNFDSHRVYPYSTVGVLYFKQDGVPYRCSAVSIGNNAIWTAGHCIHKGNNKETGWSTDLAFAPAYRNGSYPYGTWAGVTLKTKQAWFENGDLRCDMGGAILNEWEKQTVSDFVGSLGFAYNLDNDLHWTNIAYPSSNPFNGETQQICAGSFAYADTSFPDPSPVAMGCDMTRGSSGGPWIISFSGQSGQTNFLNGNNSYRYSIHPKELFSPYFGDAAKSLYDSLQAGITTNSDN